MLCIEYKAYCEVSEGLRTVVTCMCVWRGGEAGLW